MVDTMAPNSPARTRGFTLIELLISLVIVAVLATIAVPSMRELILTQSVRTSAADLQTALIFARSEAIKRAADVSVVPVGSAWTNGWTVQTGNGTVLRRQNALSTNLSTIAGTPITYRSNGRVASAPGQLVFNTALTGVAARCVVLDLSGRPSVVYDSAHSSNGCH